MFTNPVVGGTTLIRPAIQSPNYVAGTSGWSINQDGSAEFNGVTIRGTLQSSNYVLNTSGWQLNNNGTAFFNGTLTMGGSGIIRTSPNSPRIEIGPGASGGTNAITFLDGSGIAAGTILVPGSNEIDITAGFTATSTVRVFNGGIQVNADATTGTSTVQGAAVNITASNGFCTIAGSSGIRFSNRLTDHYGYPLASCVAGSTLSGSGSETGIVMQSGTAVLNFSSGNATFTFPTAFPHAILSFVAMNGDSGGSAGGPTAIYSSSGTTISNTGMSLAAPSGAGVSGNARFNWIAAGY